MILQIKQLELYQVWNDYRAEDKPEVNKFGVYTLTAPVTDRLTESVDGV
jgi:hypothetical protein